ncbi:hypothetical protein NQ318_019745 [Aromia moschata]|uniref:CCHC-type domain-containing protein n=1 Tax=Aromia moschata TaxID=1265417 RepID=A0AAV8XCQ4_9CUCU|nr:hypothetical protein NQ318_019745 [Aromia moschata]
MLAVPVLSYSFGVVKWTVGELRQLDRDTRKMMHMHRGLHPRSSVPRIYRDIQKKTSSDPLLCLVRDHELAGVGEFILKAAGTTAEKLGLDFEIRRGGRRGVNVELITELQPNRLGAQMKAAEQRVLFEQHVGRPVHGGFYKNIDALDLSTKLTFRYLLFEHRTLYPGHKVMLVVLIIGVLGGVCSKLLSELKIIPACRISMEFLLCRMQKAVILGSLRLLRHTILEHAATYRPERKSDDRRTNNDDERTVRRQNDDDRRTVRRQKGERKSDGRRTNGGDRRTVRRQKGERNSDGKRTNGGDRRTNDDDKRTETRRRGVGQKVNRIEKEFQENREEIERRLERRLEDTKRQVQKEILEKIEGLEHQLHRTSIADSGDCSTSPATPLQHSSLMHTERSVHKMLKPPTYDGQSSWSMYRRQFEAAAKANGWTPQEMATSLVISLRGQALEILQSIPEEQQNDYDRIVGALEIRYGHKYLRQVYQSQIKSRQQRSNESLQEYEADIERLIHLAYPQAPKEFLEQIGIQTFIDGLVDTEMQQALRLGRHTTISDALVAALEFKAAKEASRSYKSRVRQVKFDECQSLPETMEKIMRALDEIKQSNSPQKETRRCYNCGKIGHLQRFCRARSRSQSRTNSPDRQPDSRSRSRSPDKRNWREENGTDWDKLVPLFLLSYRSSQHESTTYTPSMLTSGREMKLPTDLILGHPVEENQERSLPEFVEDLRERMDRIHQFAREKLKIHSDKNEAASRHYINKDCI